MCEVLICVQNAIFELTGNSVTRESEILHIGMDSFGATALLTTLRPSLPEVRAMPPRMIYSFPTIGQLVDHIHGLDEQRDDDDIAFHDVRGEFSVY